MAHVTVFINDQLLEEITRQAETEACRKLDELAKKLGNWDPQATIRKFRDTNLKDSS